MKQIAIEILRIGAHPYGRTALLIFNNRSTAAGLALISVPSAGGATRPPSLTVKHIGLAAAMH
jgi:hypothetical protein